MKISKVKLIDDSGVEVMEINIDDICTDTSVDDRCEIRECLYAARDAINAIIDEIIAEDGLRTRNMISLVRSSTLATP